MNRFERFIYACFRYVPGWVLTVVVVAAIAYLTLARFEIEPDEVPDIPYLDKVVHFIMFGGLSWTMALDFAAHRRCTDLQRVRPCRVVTVTAVVSSLAGALVEVAQGAMHNGRSEDWWDWAADTAGAVVGAWIAWAMIRRLMRYECIDGSSDSSSQS